MTRSNILNFLWIAVAFLIAGYLLVPIALVVLFSFNTSALTSLPLSGLTLDWYGSYSRSTISGQRCRTASS